MTFRAYRDNKNQSGSVQHELIKHRKVGATTVLMWRPRITQPNRMISYRSLVDCSRI